MRQIILFLLLLATTVQVFSSEKEVDRLSHRIAIINDGYFRVIAINTGQGIVLIDTHLSPEDMLECKAIFSEEFGTDTFSHVIYSHGDLEHILGFEALPEATHIAHAGLKMKLEQRQEFFPQMDSMIAVKEARLMELDSLQEEYQTIQNEINGAHWQKNAYIRAKDELHPDIEFTDRMKLHFDSLSIELIYYGMGHGYSIFVSIPEEDFLFSSTASPRLPSPFWFIEYNEHFVDMEKSIGVLAEFVNQQDTLDYIVPCHGPYLKNAQLKMLYDYHQIMYNKTMEYVKAEKTLEEARAELALQKLFSGYSFAEDPLEEATEKHENNIDMLWRYLQEMKP